MEAPKNGTPPPQPPAPQLRDPPELTAEFVQEQFEGAIKALQEKAAEMMAPIPEGLHPRMLDALRSVKEETRTELAYIHGQIEVLTTMARATRVIDFPTFQKWVELVLQTLSQTRPPQPGGPNAPVASPEPPAGDGPEGEPSGSPE